MPDILDGNGLTVKTKQESLSDLIAGAQDIFGADINVEQNSPDGQLLNLIAQAATDIRELIAGVNANFDPDQAAGSILNQRVVINHIERKAGTFTIQPIEVTVDRDVSLEGLDNDATSLTATGYTVQDDAGNKFILLASVDLDADTTTELNFRAADIGQVLTTTNTITTPVTVVLGVTDVNNPSAALSVGEDEETDAELRIRRQQSPGIRSSGYINSLLAKVLDLDGVDYARLFENYEDDPDDDDIPGHAIWLIVQGGDDEDIANVMYATKAPGCNMLGDVEVDIETASGATKTFKFDRPEAEALHIQFDLQGTVTTPSIDEAALKAYIVENLKFDIGQYADTATITAIALAGMNATGAGAIPVNLEISLDGIAWEDYLETSALNKQFTVSTGNIDITVL